MVVICQPAWPCRLCSGTWLPASFVPDDEYDPLHAWGYLLACRRRTGTNIAFRLGMRRRSVKFAENKSSYVNPGEMRLEVFPLRIPAHPVVVLADFVRHLELLELGLGFWGGLPLVLLSFLVREAELVVGNDFAHLLEALSDVLSRYVLSRSCTLLSSTNKTWLISKVPFNVFVSPSANVWSICGLGFRSLFKR